MHHQTLGCVVTIVNYNFIGKECNGPGTRCCGIHMVVCMLLCCNDLQLVGSEKQNSYVVGYTFMHVCSCAEVISCSTPVCALICTLSKLNGQPRTSHLVLQLPIHHVARMTPQIDAASNTGVLSVCVHWLWLDHQVLLKPTI